MRCCVPYPEPEPLRQKIIPVFLPFAGCPGRCIFCAQHAQTNTPPRPLAAILETMVRQLEHLDAENKRLELSRTFDLGLYGGTFTALDARWMDAFLYEAMRFTAKGLLRHIRCSTRPDCVSPALLKKLASAGLHMVELGVQSFDGQALAISGRGYSRKTALDACAMVRDAGLELGVQLMPGLPGASLETFQRDIETVCALSNLPQTLRLYPCLVLEGTALAQIWRKGGYSPWNMDDAVEALAKACLAVWKKHIRVIRLGVKEEETLARAVLAGPRHPAFGDKVRGTALKIWLLETVRQRKPDGARLAMVYAPKRLQGAFWGHCRIFRDEYAAYGIRPDNVRFHARPDFAIEYTGDSQRRSVNG